MEEYKYLFDSNTIVAVYFENVNIRLPALLEIFKKLTTPPGILEYKNNLEEGWEKFLLGLGIKFTRLFLCPTKITNFEILTNLCKNETNITLKHDNLNFDENELNKYFKMTDKYVNGQLRINELTAVPKP